jgi:hypothetical protein
MTLLEVVAGLALLASLLGAVVMAKGRYARQAAAADRRLQAVAAADALLAGWHLNPRSLPQAFSGSAAVPGDAGLAWRLRPVANGGVEELGGRVVRVEILDERVTPSPVIVAVETVVEEPADVAKPPATRPPERRVTKGKARTDAKGVHHP